MPQVKMVKSIEPVQRKDKKGIYHKVTWADDTSDSVFSPDILKVLEQALVEKCAVQLVKEKNDRGFFNITEAKIVTAEDLPPPQEPVRKYPEPPPDAPQDTRKPVEASSKAIISGQELGMWYKELGESLRSDLIDKTTAQGKALKRFYFLRMFDVLGIKVEKKQTETSEPETEN